MIMPNREWLSKIPKIELHAHLHGSIRMTELQYLHNKYIKERDPNEKIKDILKVHKTFDEVFEIFDIIHKVVCTEKILRRITHQVLEDFCKENVKYLELRSTPRKLKYSNHSRKDYVKIILNAIRDFPKKFPKYDIIVRLILTIQNVKPIEEAIETLDIIEELNDHLIVGIDFAPRPVKDKGFRYFSKVLNRARNMGLKITVHYAEYYDREEQDLILDFHPDRLGHAVHLRKNDYERLSKNPIPIEVCATSNLICRSIKSYQQHPFRILGKNYPLLFCTDDSGVFGTTLTDEWLHMCNAHYLTENDVKKIMKMSIDFIFESEQIKTNLKKYFI